MGSSTSAEDGTWQVPLPGPDDYDVRLDVASLPEDVAPTDPDRVELAGVNVRPGQQRQVFLQLGEGAGGGLSTFSRVASLLVVGLKLGAIIALSSVGLSLVFGVTWWSTCPTVSW